MGEQLPILIVEDENDVATLMKTALEKAGFSVDLVENGEDALTKLGAKHYGMVLLDIMLPRADGFEICRRIKTGSTTKQIPVIAITALDIPDIAKRCFAVGAEEVILKPFEIDDLVAKVNQFTKPKSP